MCLFAAEWYGQGLGWAAGSALLDAGIIKIFALFCARVRYRAFTVFVDSTFI